ncbi:hypothetical protein HKD37_06G015733 [Glycine soja]
MILVDRARVLIVVLSVVGKIPLGLLFRSVAYEFLLSLTEICVVVVGNADNSGKGLEVGVCVKDFLGVASVLTEEMEVYGKSMVAGPANVIFLSSILGQEGPVPGHKCDWKCQNEHVCGNMYRCKLTGLTHICDKNCNQRILYDNHSSLCRASGQIFPLSPAEEQAVRGVRRKLDAENSPSESCGFKRRRGDAQIHPSPFERSFSAVSPICSQVGDGMDMS